MSQQTPTKENLSSTASDQRLPGSTEPAPEGYSPIKRDIAAPVWGPRWKAPFLMSLFLVAGIAFALGHNYYYESLNNDAAPSADQQQWSFRIGTGLATLTETALVAAVGIAFTQYLWVVLRERHLPLRSIDGVFSVTSDPTSFLDRNIIFRTKILPIIALACW